ncbi:Crp/Fnr family transcriptional regulator [Acidimangrovimonas sediminis]|uniref:Crp/Fnr family transcriptional regulator n=1 Tax=Acidimangrovimonas sediminis TaxID=2056283 RepID=UPI000C8087CA|nr:Crp/Fnr family transcriptional regulator [Acidimangrovimonas sediminis]
MTLNDEALLLKRIPLFSGATPGALKLLAFTSERLSLGVGEALFHHGDSGEAAYVILTGRLEILAERTGKDVRLVELGPNSLVGEISILCGVARTATVRAVTPSEVLRIGKDPFLKLLHDSPEMAEQVIRVLADRLSKTTAELTRLKAEQALGRV